MNAPTLLWAFLRRAGITRKAFARKAGIASSIVYRAMSGQRRVDMDTAARIERASGGAVPVASWANWRHRAA